jgi:hypothetical protein
MGDLGVCIMSENAGVVFLIIRAFIFHHGGYKAITKERKA